MGYEDQGVTELRKLAIDRDVVWKYEDGKPMRKGDLTSALEKHDAKAAQDAAEASAGAPVADPAPPSGDEGALEPGEPIGDGQGERGPDDTSGTPPDATTVPEAPESPPEPSPDETAKASAEAPPASGARAQDDGGGETGSTADDDPETTIAPPERAPEQWIRITKEVRFRKGGVTHKLAKGSVISNRTHDVEALGPQLAAQGWPIEECGPPEGGLNSYGRPVGRVFGPPLPTTRDQRTFDEEVNPQLYADRDASGQTVRLEGDGSRTAIPREEPHTITTADGRTAVARTDPDTGKPSPGAVTNG